MLPTDPAYQLTDLIRLTRPLESAFYAPSATAVCGDGSLPVSGGAGAQTMPPCDLDALHLLDTIDTLLLHPSVPPYLQQSSPYPPAVLAALPLHMWYRSLPRVGRLELLAWVVTDEAAPVPSAFRDVLAATWSAVRSELGLATASGRSLHEPMTLPEMADATRLSLATLQMIADSGDMVHWSIEGVDYYQIPRLPTATVKEVDGE